jgi:hypothetical protein
LFFSAYCKLGCFFLNWLICTKCQRILILHRLSGWLICFIGLLDLKGFRRTLINGFWFRLFSCFGFGRLLFARYSFRTRRLNLFGLLMLLLMDRLRFRGTRFYGFMLSIMSRFFILLFLDWSIWWLSFLRTRLWWYISNVLSGACLIRFGLLNWRLRLKIRFSTH